MIAAYGRDQAGFCRCVRSIWLGISRCGKPGRRDLAHSPGRRRLKPTNHTAWSNLAAVFREAGRIDEAIAAQRQSVMLRPDNAEGQWMLGNLLLLNGDTTEGAPLLECRWKRKALPWPRRKLSQPMWDGSDLAGRTIYLHRRAEHLRRDPLFPIHGACRRAAAEKIVVECQPALRRLFENSFTAEQWFSPGEPTPAFDVYCPLLEFAEIAQDDGRGRCAISESSLRQLDKIVSDPGLLKVGLAWAGSPSEIEDRKRSMSSG